MNERVFQTRPWLKEVLWGSDKLQLGWGKAADAATRLGESWEVSAMPGCESGLIDEALDLRGAFEADAGFFVRDAKTSRFPLLVKLLSTSELLSVQVHPDDEQALRLEGEANGKHEAWLVLEANDDAFLYLGFKQGVGVEDLEAALSAGTPEAVARLLRRVKAWPGEVYDVPPGTVHAIGPGLVLLEIQQPSDATYRVFDWCRVDQNGRARELHVSRALQVIAPRSRPFPCGPLGPSPYAPGKRLLAHEAFSLERWKIEGEVSLPNDDLLVLVALSGSGSATASGEERVGLVKGRTCVVPRVVDNLRLSGAALELAAIRPPPATCQS